MIERYLMAKKAVKKEETKADVFVEEPAVAPDKLVRVRNAGEPFVFDLSAHGYGQRWPSNAVYSIPFKVYMKCLEAGFEGVAA